MLEPAYGKKMSIEKYKDVASPDTTTDEIVVNKEGSLFMNIFCNYPEDDYLSAPIFLNLSNLKNVINEIKQAKLNNDNNMYNLSNEIRERKNDEKVYLRNIENIYNNYMPVFRIKDNPNKFLWEALNIRKQKSFILASSADDTHLNDVSNPLNKFYMGLDRVAQFLNFCVMLRGLPKQLEGNSEVVVEPEPLQFEARVLEELLHQFDQDLKAVSEIFDDNERADFGAKLKVLHEKYDQYCSDRINDGQDNLMPFAKWINPMVQEENKCTSKVHLFPAVDNIINDENEL